MNVQNPELYKNIRISSIREEVRDFKLISFEEGHGIIYQPGQYLTLVRHNGLEEVRRSYSIISSPILREPLSIGIKRITNGYFSRELTDHSRPGDLLKTIGAGGFFTLPLNFENERQVFFFAAGSGITPVYSLLKTVLYSRHSCSAVLIYSSYSPEKTVFHNSLNEMAGLFPDRLHIRFLFSNSADLASARLYRELMIQLLNTYAEKPLKELLFFICGPEAYMRMCTYILQEQKVPKDHIRKENFIIHSSAPVLPLPPDKTTRNVELYISGKHFRFSVPFPLSILQAAKKQGIALPYSCEIGKCGSCVAKCIQGRVWLSYNEILTGKELEAGFILSCVGHPVGGDVVIKIN